jgi:hypothetical protein
MCEASVALAIERSVSFKAGFWRLNDGGGIENMRKTSSKEGGLLKNETEGGLLRRQKT